VRFLRGQFVEAEPDYRRALELYRGAVGPRHPAVARTLHSLGLIYHGLGQYDEAEQLYRRALDTFTADFGAGDPSAAATRIELAAMLTERGEPERAEPEARAALAAYGRAPGDWDLRRGYGLSSLGFALRKQGRTDEAAAAFEQALALITKVRGERSSDLPPGLIELGEIYTEKGRYADAEAALRRAVAIRERDGALTPWGLAKALSALAQLRLAQGQGEEALAEAERATAIVRDRLDTAGQSLSAAAQGEVVSARQIIERQLEIGDRMRPRARGDDLLAAMFEAAQLPHLTSVAASLAEATVKLRPDQRELATLVGERQDALEQWRALDRLLLDRMAAGTLGPADEHQLREELERLTATVRTIDDTIRSRFADYADLTNPKPVDASAIQDVLRPGEALLLQVTGEQASYLFLVRPDGLSYARIGLTARELDAAVRALRAGVELAPGKRLDELPAFDVGAAHRLYQGLLAPFEAELAAVRHLIVVPDGAMRSLPFAILLRSAPAVPPGNSDREGLLDLDFVGESLAFSTVPSADSFVSLRRRAGSSPAAQPFLGFGDPLLGPSLPPEFRSAYQDDTAARGVATRAPSPELFWNRGTEFDPRAFTLLVPLPDTRDELLALATAFGARDPHAALRLGPDATETRVRTEGDLKDHRVIAFATHGLLAGDFAGLAEPALVLTPPAKPAPADDGLLTASEVAGLDLDADWVILSACNTAAGDRPGAEGLSGLARAFFHAGSRALLVSHWSVPSEAATALTVFSAQALAADPAIGRAEALRRATLRVMNGEHPDGRTRRRHAHPIFWAPFVNVGEGGAGP
jgi:CHAT domain-containing protein/Tfp pilus assembly protein PilF